MSTANQHTCSQLVGEEIDLIALAILVLQVRTGLVFSVYCRLHVSHTTAAIEVVDR